MQKLTFKTGHTSCPACSLLGTPQEPYMAVPTVDDRVYCYACMKVTSGILEANRFRIFPTIQSLPKPVLDTVMALISVGVADDGSVASTYMIADAGAKGLGFSDPMTAGDMQRAAGAVACGNADVLIDEAERITIKLSHGPYNFHTAAVSFKPSTLRVADLKEDESGVRDVYALLERLTGPESNAVRQLARLGYRLGGCDVDSSMRFVRMSIGSAREGIAAEFHWIP